MRRACLLALSSIAVLALHAPVAVQAAAASAPQTASDMDSELTEHQNMREERRKLFEEHEALEDESDSLKVACMDAKGQDRDDCAQKKQVLQDKRADLHRRLKEFHERAEAERKAWMEHHPHAAQAVAAPPPSNQP